MIHTKRLRKATMEKITTEDGTSNASGVPPSSKRNSDDEDEESGNESDVTNATGNVSDGEV